MEDNNLQETLDTGVVYLIKNNINGKIYIGSANSFDKHGPSYPPTKYGAKGRFTRHCSNAFSPNNLTATECPLLYEDIRQYGKESFTYTTLKVCDKKHLKEREACSIREYKSYKPEIGYNIMTGTKKPEEGERKDEYEKQRAMINVKRAEDGSMKKAEHNIGLPANINYRKNKNQNGLETEGYFVQIKMNGKLYNKGFMSMKLTMEEKLEMAKQWLKNIKEV